MSMGDMADMVNDDTPMDDTQYACPKCGEESDADWLVTVAGHVVRGGCQKCWESECDKTWAEAMNDLSARAGKAGQGNDCTPTGA